MLSDLSTFSINSQYPDGRLHHRQRFMRALLAILLVILFGTGGILVTEESWEVWQALYFTLITITTVGYGDMGLSESGQRFTTLLLVVGIATTTYAFGQLIQAAFAYQQDWRGRMQKSIDQLHGHAIVCGAGRVGRTACAQLRKEGRGIVLIDRDGRHIEWARNEGIPLLIGCGTEDEVLRLAGIDRAYGLVCATSSDAENIMISLSAHDLNKNLVVVSRAQEVESIRKLERAGANHVVAPAINGGRELATLLVHPHVSRFLRESYEAESSFRLTAVSIEPGSSIVGKTAREVGIAEPSLVFVAIQREGHDTRIRLRADEQFEDNDIVIVVGDHEAVARMAKEASAEPITA